MIKRIAYGGLALGLSLLVSFLCVEAYYRAFPPLGLKQRAEALSYFGMMRYDPEIGRLFKTNFSGDVALDGERFHVATNSLGLRGPEPLSTADYRVLFLGDSFTFGYGVEEAASFPGLVRAALPSGVDVVNAGVSGWGPTQESRFLKKVGLGLKPDLIILGFYMNDIRDMFLTDLQHADDSLVIWQTKQAARLLAGHFWEKSYALTAVREALGNVNKMVRGTYLKRTNRVELGSREVVDDELWTVPPGGITAVDLSSPLSSDLEIESWGGVSLSDNEVQLKIWRRQADGAYENIGQSSIQHVRSGTFTFGLDKVIQARAGDYLGFFASSGNMARLLPYRGNKVYQFGNAAVLLPGRMVADRAGAYAITIVGKVSSQSALTMPVAEDHQFNTLPAGNRVIGSIATHELAIYQSPYQSDTATSIDLAIERICEMATMAKSKNARFAVAYLPSYVDTEKMAPRFLAEMRAKRDELGLSSDHFRHTLVSRLREKGVTVLDMTDAFRTSDIENLYLSDTHFNTAGHALTAKVLTDYIRPLIKARATSSRTH